MSAPQHILIRSFAPADPALIAQLLREASPEYVRFFQPFEFSAEVIEHFVSRSEKDQWFMLEIERDGALQPAGFYSLRGLDEGFADPMYGVFIAEDFSGHGFARLTLAHAESTCRLNGWSNLLLKVDPANRRAFALYEASGFRFLKLDPATGNQVLVEASLNPNPQLPFTIMNWQETTVLVTGGTGSFGRKFVEILQRDYHPKKLIVFSRDELKQHEMRQIFPEKDHMRYFIGDVRDHDRLERAFRGVDLVVHAAALKQVPACEYNPIEAINTNIIGAKNVIEAAIDQGVPKVLALSTDKAVNPANLYGATKLCAEKLFVQGNAYSGADKTRFSCVRYGNVVGSRGSVVPLFAEQRKTGKITITDPRMTRFWLTLDQGVRFVIHCIEAMHGGEVFVPKIPSMNIMDLAAALAPECKIENIGIRPGEKLHEALLSEDEARNTIELDDMFVVEPQHPFWKLDSWPNGTRPAEGFRYSSETNTQWLNADDLRKLIGSVT